jgi:putative membrane protein
MSLFRGQVGLALKGMAMGIAEVIPGVSGGTIAFITGIYEKLINTIKAFGPSLIGVFQKDGIVGVWAAMNGNFLVALMVGMVGGVVIGVFGVTHLLEEFPQHLWGFFFGLIIASAIYIGKQVSKWGAYEIVGFLLGTAVAYYITIASPASGNEALWFVFLSGMIAISALILPGISGSFILLLMGMYTFILPNVKEALTTFSSESLMITGVFALGCLVGITSISRVISWMFDHFKNTTLAVLTGFMVGSLNKVWPWRNTTQWIDKESGGILSNIENYATPDDLKILKEVSVSPDNFLGDPHMIPVMILMVVGFLAVFGLEKIGSKSE